MSRKVSPTGPHSLSQNEASLRALPLVPSCGLRADLGVSSPRNSSVGLESESIQPVEGVRSQEFVGPPPTSPTHSPGGAESVLGAPVLSAGLESGGPVVTSSIAFLRGILQIRKWKLCRARGASCREQGWTRGPASPGAQKHVQGTAGHGVKVCPEDLKKWDPSACSRSCPITAAPWPEVRG